MIKKSINFEQKYKQKLIIKKIDNSFTTHLKKATLHKIYVYSVKKLKKNHLRLFWKHFAICCPCLDNSTNLLNLICLMISSISENKPVTGKISISNLLIFGLQRGITVSFHCKYFITEN